VVAGGTTTVFVVVVFETPARADQVYVCVVPCEVEASAYPFCCTASLEWLARYENASTEFGTVPKDPHDLPFCLGVSEKRDCSRPLGRPLGGGTVNRDRGAMGRYRSR
jgi:hypothetical protein